MSAHRSHPITTEHFVQWLELWRATADEILAPEHAELLHEYAGRIGRSLRYGLGLPEPGETRSPFGPGVDRKSAVSGEDWYVRVKLGGGGVITKQIQTKEKKT